MNELNAIHDIDMRVSKSSEESFTSAGRAASPMWSSLRHLSPTLKLLGGSWAQNASHVSSYLEISPAA